MKVEILIYAYLAVCAAMTGFNIACIFLFRRNDRKLYERCGDYADVIRKQMHKDAIDEAHRSFLLKSLVHVKGLLAFERSLDILNREDSAALERYLGQLVPVFARLTLEYSRKNEVQAAYFPYLISRYGFFKGQDIPSINDVLFALLPSSGIYSRENALAAFYSIGNAAHVAQALEIVDRSGYYHHKKLITDGLMTFQGDCRELQEMLWARLDVYSVAMQTAILDYLRFSTGAFCERMLGLLSDHYDSEINFCAIRYFGKYRYEPAYPALLGYLEHEDSARWEYAAIAAFSLAAYPSEQTVRALKAKLNSRSWFVRFNASQSLDKLGMEYVDVVDVFESNDRYAGEMMRYRLEQKKLRERELRHP